ncbi:phenylacetate--CoA ligase family protein [Sphingobacterium sp. N143]|uniref:phenylacetate--CoA ligase family protein n=1 Tax=Sphingobacterium sp. N143 TaxID=2746727 RepID=UPI0025756A4E|nr:hypothetical protein [Sphingobacterium sp. N143]MDM1295932.1 phenylacetate--CoA ligase family protein [Sphingobacterium sp. N143]
MLKKIYDNSPTVLQDLFLTLQAFKYRKFRQGGRYNEFLSFLRKSQHFSKEELFNWQLEQFKKVFGEAYDNTSYYKQLFDNYNIDPKSVRDFDFLKQLPVLTKDILRQHPSRFINKERKIVYTAKTGGTTGAPLITPFDGESTQWAFAFLARFFEQNGVQYGDRNLHMTGQQVVPLNEKKKFWRTDFLGKSLYLSVHHLGPKTFHLYWNKIISFRPKYIFGYTSFIYDLARHVNQNNKSGQLKLQAIFPSSEKLTDEMRSEMELAFSCKVLDHYGSTEGIPLITECKMGNYHVVPESGIVEFLNEQGEPAVVGEQAEMIMTSLRQLSRPILRYKIGDTAILSPDNCTCGLHWPVIQELTGRLSEWITLKDGRRISQFSHQVFKMVSNVIESQIIQEGYDVFKVLIVKSDQFTVDDEVFIGDRFRDLIGSKVVIEFEYVEAIPKTIGGKKPSLISKVK